MFVKEPPFVAYKWIPKLHGKEVAMSDQVVYIISCQGAFVPIKNDHIQSFNSQPLISCLWLPIQAIEVTI